MPNSSKTPSRLPPSVVLFGVTLVLIALCALLGVGLLISTWKTSSPVQTGALPIQPLTTPTVDAIPTLPETVVPAAPVIATPTLKFVLSFPPKVTPFPTFDPAFVPTIAPLTDWVTYTDELEGFSIRYPKGWLVSVLPLEIRQNSGGYSSSISNYDPASPAIQDLQHHTPPQLFKLDISVDKPGNLPDFPLPPGKTIEDWVRENAIPSDSTVIREEGNMTISGVPAFRRVTEESEGFLRVAIWFVKGDQKFGLSYWLYAGNQELADTADQLVASFQFLP